MTLNITVLTDEAVYQSADYALFDQRSGRPLRMPSTKVVVLHYPDWTGFVTYTGIGFDGRKHTSEHVRDWLAGQLRPSFEQVADKIRERATQWVRQVSPGVRQTFVLAGFVNGVPTAGVISNFQRWHGADEKLVQQSLSVSTIVARTQPEVIVTGIREAVPRIRRRQLQRLAGGGQSDPSRLRRAIAAAIREGARGQQGRISEDCFVYSQDREGRGHYEVMGGTRTDPVSLIGEAGDEQVIRTLLDREFGRGRWTLRGMTSGRSGPENSVVPRPCVPQQARIGQRNRYQLIELAMPEGRRAIPWSIAPTGEIVGEACFEWGGSSYACLWSVRDRIDLLPHGGGFGSRALDVSDSRVIVGSSEWPDRRSRACVWHTDGRLSDMGLSVGLHSQGQAIGARGDIVGWASVHSTDGGQDHQRPAYWPAQGPPVVLRDLSGGWGEAVDMDASGVILIAVHKGSSIALSTEVEARLWDGELATEAIAKGADVASFYPKCLTNDGRAIGLAIMRNGQRSGEIASLAGGSRVPMFEPLPGRELTAANRSIVIGGYDLVEDYRVPWVKQYGGEMVYLPHYRYHHHSVTMISESGFAIGKAASDNCCHPLLWIPI